MKIKKEEKKNLQLKFRRNLQINHIIIQLLHNVANYKSNYNECSIFNVNFSYKYPINFSIKFREPIFLSFLYSQFNK